MATAESRQLDRENFGLDEAYDDLVAKIVKARGVPSVTFGQPSVDDLEERIRRGYLEGEDLDDDVASVQGVRDADSAGTDDRRQNDAGQRRTGHDRHGRRRHDERRPQGADEAGEGIAGSGDVGADDAAHANTLAGLYRSGGLSLADATRLSGAQVDFDPTDDAAVDVANAANLLQSFAVLIASKKEWTTEGPDVAEARTKAAYAAFEDEIASFVESGYNTRNQRRVGIALADLILSLLWAGVAAGVSLGDLLPERAAVMMVD